jgi:hypothetical protein
VALLDSEIARIKHELGYNVLTNSAMPYVDVVAVFENVIQSYVQAGASTTSATAVTAASVATPVTLTLASGTGFASGARVVIDVDDRQEVVTAQLVSGASLTVMLVKAHTGTYPVTVEGGESMVREVLGRLRTVGDKLANAATKAGIKRVDEIEFFGSSSSGMSGVFRELTRQRDSWRDELAALLGIQRLNGGAGGATVSLY